MALSGDGLVSTRGRERRALAPTRERHRTKRSGAARRVAVFDAAQHAARESSGAEAQVDLEANEATVAQRFFAEREGAVQLRGGQDLAQRGLVGVRSPKPRRERLVERAPGGRKGDAEREQHVVVALRAALRCLNTRELGRAGGGDPDRHLARAALRSVVDPGGLLPFEGGAVLTVCQSQDLLGREAERRRFLR